jgi:hypothetical protein
VAEADVHEKAARTHKDAAARHEQAARFWDDHGDPELAALERRNAAIERDAAELETDRARVAGQRHVDS